MPKKIPEIIAALIAAGFREQAGAGKGSHRKFVHERYAGIVTVSGNGGDDAKRYQEHQVRKAIEAIDEND